LFGRSNRPDTANEHLDLHPSLPTGHLRHAPTVPVSRIVERQESHESYNQRKADWFQTAHAYPKTRPRRFQMPKTNSSPAKHQSKCKHAHRRALDAREREDLMQPVCEPENLKPI